MSQDKNLRLTEEGVREDFQRQPYIFMRLAENALTVAESFRDNYLKNTAQFITNLRRAMQRPPTGEQGDPMLTVTRIENAKWADVSGEVVTFIDGGVGSVQLSSQVPILLRVGSYCVRTGERQLSERERFGYYPVILGDIEGGSKERKDFPDIIRITAELLGGLSALERTPDLNVLMFHGPLVYLMGAYAGHTPFTEKDIDLFLNHYAAAPEMGHQLKEEFLREASLDIYPQMTDHCAEWTRQRVFEPLAWIAYLYRCLIREARKRTPIPIICGAVERGQLREFSEKVLMKRVFRGLRENKRENYFNEMYGRTDLTTEKTFLDRLGYTDALLLAMLLEPGEASESWEIAKYDGLNRGKASLPHEAFKADVDFTLLRPSEFGFPRVTGCYVRVTENTEPIRVEVFTELGEEQMREAARRVYLYSRMLPGYGFPVGLDIADKFAKVPAWLTEAYGKLIRHHLGVSLQKGEISDAEMRRLLVQAIYMTHRDWLFRPQS